MGGIPGIYANLTPAGLSQAAGETGTGSQQTTFNAMTQFMGLLTDPFIAGRGDPASAGGRSTGYADEEARAYAAKRNPNNALAAIYTKAPPPVAFEQRWSIWAAGFGGSQNHRRQYLGRLQHRDVAPLRRRRGRRLSLLAIDDRGFRAGRRRHQLQRGPNNGTGTFRPVPGRRVHPA